MTSLSRQQLARRAFNRAVSRLEAAQDAGLISAGDASVKYRALYVAYLRRKDDLELAAFLGRHGLKPSKHFEKLDRTLAEIDPETQRNQEAA